MGRWLLQKWGGGYTNLSTREKEVYRVTKGHEGVIIHFLPVARRSAVAKNQVVHHNQIMKTMKRAIKSGKRR